MLKTHRAERSSTLATALATVLATPLADPFSPEIVAVPAKGVERWLSQRLSLSLGATSGDGVAANIEFLSPTTLVDEILATAHGTTALDDPWSYSTVVWTILEVVDASLDERWAGVLARHLGHGASDHRAGRRYSTAAHIADLFRGYGSQRPQLFVDWAAGRDTDGLGSDLDPDLLWQPELWRRLRDRIGVDNPAQRLDEACRRIREEPELLDLPDRVSLFGPTRVSAEQLAVLTALSVRRDVHLWLPHPSPVLWTKLSTATVARRDTRRADDDTAMQVEHPLLASLARDVREVQSRLMATGVSYDDVYYADPQPDSDTLLHRVQADIRSDRLPTPGTDLDTTLQIHSCHGAPRQVEVLRECLLRLFDDDSTLEPRDVLVMCPDVETFAPLVRAAFGQGELRHPGHKLRARLADRALRQTNPLLDAVATLLWLADGRVTASQVLDFAATIPVRRRFGFSDQDLERLREWSGEAGARWGLGRAQRSAFGLADFPQNTFTTALDRILLGVAADETEVAWLDLALPLDDVDSNDIDLAGRFAEYIDRLAVVLHALRGPQQAAAWTAALTRALDLLTDVSRSDAWQTAQAHRELGAATEHSGTIELRLPDVRVMLADRLAGRPTRANFRTGELTIATLVPMRSVPHRVVVLLGLDDEVYPRAAGLDGDDVLSRDPCLGERDPRSEDRQLLLDAVMSASEKLLIFYTGADPLTGAPRPPAVPLGEFVDVVKATVATAAAAAVVTQHPLQPFDSRNFTGPVPFSYDPAGLAGARARQTPPLPAPPLLVAPLPPRQGDVNLNELVEFFEHSSRAFLRQRLNVRVPERDDDVADALGVELDGLAKWDIGERMLTARLAGAPIAELRAAEWRRGTLPPFALGSAVLDDVSRTVESLFAAAAPVHVGAAETVDVAVELGNGRRLTGTVTGVHGHVVAAASYSKLAPKHRLRAWILLLALAASHSGRWEAISTGRGFGRSLRRSSLLAPRDPVAVLNQLVDLRDRGLEQPLPMATAASAVYAERRSTGSNPDDALLAASDEFGGPYGEVNDRHIAYIHGAIPRFEVLAADVPLADESDWGPNSGAEPTRFGTLACRLWFPLLASESVTQP
ncbi:exodeoxyribonuclease V subunit gamma [Antrihabitans sp. YC3-6]|uniref:RecBCD enzyme subunit RecC n=1 Tax=Antrihabitans stalagmiti TaxID=2799499 RepID=A0A934NWS1_9NOCA|nr:exodeoxyribonuclease V subunit gamma [Antrihabitans stalagmiti]MBJ8342637.1 exodeoxyribonuclease V subunit gamma [Antrihabitans stalagmiti]